MNKALDNLLESRPISADDAAELTRAFPYFISADIAALDTTRDPQKRAVLKRRIAAYVGLPDVLLNLFGSDGDELADFYPDMHAPDPSTSETIDAFLNKFSSGAALGPDPLDFAPAVDYAAIIEAEEQTAPAPQTPGGDSVAAALSGLQALSSRRAGLSLSDEEPADTAPAAEVTAPDTPPAEKPREQAPAPTPLSEQLAHMLIRNGNYSKALQILSQLNLTFPEKSVYFADQIRFLKKLIINENHKN